MALSVNLPWRRLARLLPVRIYWPGAKVIFAEAMDKALLNRLYRYAISLTGDGDEAYDLLQQAVERYLRRPDNSVRVPSAYLMQTIRNLFFDQVRHQNLHLVVSEQLQQDSARQEDAPSPADLLMYQQDVEQLMQQLGCHERELLYLWAVEESLLYFQ